MSDGNLLAQLNLVRQFLDGPTTLAPKTLRAARGLAQNLGDRIYFNAGWHAATANQGQRLGGSGSEEAIQADLTPLVDLLQARAKPARGRGRPAKEAVTGADALIIVEYLSDRTGVSLASVIDSAIRDRGYPLDKAKTTAAHVKRIERTIKRLKKTLQPKTNNVLIFRPKKKPGRKLPGK